MFRRSLCLAIIITHLLCCFCFVNYEMFQGFDHLPDNSSKTGPNLIVIPASHEVTKHSHDSSTTMKYDDLNISDMDKNILALTATEDSSISTLNKTKLKWFKTKCPETETPKSLGTYEIPTQRDLALFIQRILVRKFNSYNSKTLVLLKDIKEVTKSTKTVEKSCPVKNKRQYRMCVKRVSKKCIEITKDLVYSLELQKESVNSLLEEKVCNLTALNTDPVELAKTLSLEEASLEFALPAFLRLIGTCSDLCNIKVSSAETIIRPSREWHMTDQDLVVRHFLTNKNYLQLIKEDTTDRSKNAAVTNRMHSTHSWQ